MNLAETHNKEGYFSPTEFEAMKNRERGEKSTETGGIPTACIYLFSLSWQYQ